MRRFSLRVVAVVLVLVVGVWHEGLSVLLGAAEGLAGGVPGVLGLDAGALAGGLTGPGGGAAGSVDPVSGVLAFVSTDVVLGGPTGVGVEITRSLRPDRVVWAAECGNGVDDDGDFRADSDDGECSGGG